jgi:hypothetical protein
MDNSALKKILAGSAVLAGVGLASYLLISRRSSSARSSSPLRSSDTVIEKQQLICVLKDLLFEFHGVFVEMANMVQRLKQLGALRGPSGPMSTEQIAEFLMHQGIQGKLDSAQNRVLISHGLTQTQVELAQELYESDADVTTFVSGFNQMFEEASSGLAPVLPGIEIPEDLNEDKALEVLNLIHQERLKSFRTALEDFWKSDDSNKMGGMDPTQGPPPALAQALQKAHDEAELIVLGRFSDVIQNKVIFDSALAKFSRQTDGAFHKEKLRMERSHQVEIVNLMRNRETNETPKITPIDGLHSSLICSNEGDMAHQILEAAESKRPVVAALVRNLQDPKAALTPLSDALVNGKLESLSQRNCTFLYMPAHDDIPLANRPEYKSVDVCYIFFPRPDKQQRPIACFSLEELAEASSVDTSIYEGPGSVVFNDDRNDVD